MVAPTVGRLDPYAPVHKAIRHQLTDALQRLSAVDWDESAAVAGVLDAVDTALSSQEDHAGHEETFYHPLLESKVPGSTVSFTERHHQLARQIDRIESTVQELRNDGTPDEAQGYGLYLAFAHFVGEYLIHLDEEERVLKPLFWAHCTDDELAVLEGRVQSVVSTESMQAMTPHFLAALDRVELAAWLGGMQQGAPPVVFAAVCAAGAELVAPDTWARVAAALGLD